MAKIERRDYAPAPDVSVLHEEVITADYIRIECTDGTVKTIEDKSHKVTVSQGPVDWEIINVSIGPLKAHFTMEMGDTAVRKIMPLGVDFLNGNGETLLRLVEIMQLFIRSEGGGVLIVGREAKPV